MLRGHFYNLYVMLDIFSRYVVGWTIVARESREVAKAFLLATFNQHGIAPGQLACHSDRGASMVAKTTVQLYADLDITASFSRPRVSNDNSYSEAAFKTLKYHPDMPERFGSVEDSRSFFATLFPWYNERHRHSGHALLTPRRASSCRHRETSARAQRRVRRPPRTLCRPPRHGSTNHRTHSSSNKSSELSQSH